MTNTQLPEGCKAYVTTYLPVAGWKWVHVWLNEEEADIGPFWEPWTTSDWAWGSEAEAEVDGRLYAIDNGLPFIPRAM